MSDHRLPNDPPPVTTEEAAKMPLDQLLAAYANAAGNLALAEAGLACEGPSVYRTEMETLGTAILRKMR